MNKLLRVVVDKYFNETGFMLAATATTASLILSQVYKYIPCELCWYQRIAMFGLAVVFLMAILIKDSKSHLYALPFAAFGVIVSFYQSLLQWGVIKDVLSCSLTTPCDQPQVKILGIFTIPFGAFLFFLALLVLIALKLRRAPVNLGKQQITTAINLSLILVVLAMAFIIVKQMFF